MMHLTIEQIPSKLRGSIWACLIAPRPIALISTQDAQGVPNIAPYNAFCGLANFPPLLGISFSRREDEDKNTLANIKATQRVCHQSRAAVPGRDHEQGRRGNR